jgi:hypothetical protein
MDLQAAHSAGQKTVSLAKMFAVVCFLVAGGLLVMSLMTAPVRARLAPQAAGPASIALAAADLATPATPRRRDR